MGKKIFLSHTSLDKPFVEKLALDLKRLGIDVWYDKWEINVGDSLLMKIENGIIDSSYLAIVLSDKALESVWVMHEIESAFTKSFHQKDFKILPILYRKCELPLFLAGKKYADFTQNYEKGLSDLAKVFGISNVQICDVTNWRLFKKKRGYDWKKFHDEEFKEFAHDVFRFCFKNNIGMRPGATKNPFSMNLEARYNDKDNRYKSFIISIKLKSDNKYYMCNTKEFNPNNINQKCYNIFLGNTAHQAYEELTLYLYSLIQKYGKPDRYMHMYYFTRFLSENEKHELIHIVMNKFQYFDNIQEEIQYLDKLCEKTDEQNDMPLNLLVL